MQIIQMKSLLGAEVLGIDVGTTISIMDQALLKQALSDHLTLLLRGQNLVPVEKHIRFAQAFGSLGKIANNLLGIGPRSFQPKDIPDSVSVISNIKVNAKGIGSLGDGECFWHSDSNFAEMPPSASVLHAIEIPPEGGDTSFLDMFDALKSLPVDLRRRIDGRSMRHSKVYKSSGGIRPEFSGETDITKHPATVHPIIRTIPESGRQCLYLGRRQGSYIVGMTVAESEELLDALWEHTVQDYRVWSHSWEVGDVVVWDNRTTMHHRDPFDPNSRRRMHKVQAAGERPV
jgi:taurine dioxygenase